MCGIIAYTGKQQAADLLYECLVRFRERGFDSCGIATVYSGDLHLQSSNGNLDALPWDRLINRLPGTTGIAHCYLPTQEGVMDAEIQPKLDCQKCVTIAFNGIIDNSIRVKRRLNGQHQLSSGTDAEIIAHLIEEYLAPGISLEQAVFRIAKEIPGDYSFVMASIIEPQKLVAFTNGKPLYIGLGEGENFITNDFQFFLPYTRNTIFLENGEVAVITPGRVNLFTDSGKKMSRDATILEAEIEVPDKNGFEYFMLKEIFDQPKALALSIKQGEQTLSRAVHLIKNAERLIFTGCGSSRYASHVGSYVFSKVAKIASEVIISSEFKYFCGEVDADTLVIAVSQSGETADVLRVVCEAKRHGAKVLGLVNTYASTLARKSDCAMYLNCGYEYANAATKSFACQIAVMNLLAFSVIGKANEFEKDLKELVATIEKNLTIYHDVLYEVAQKFEEHDKIFYLAQSVNSAVAGEACLKLKEVAYVHSEGLPAGEINHGPIALIEKGTPVIAIAPCDATREGVLNNISTVKACGAFIIGVADQPHELFDVYIEIPDVKKYCYPLACIVPLQLFAFHSSVVRSITPDWPRKLLKSVTEP